MNLEVVIHRIGGAENAPRLYGPWFRPVSLDSRERVEIPASDSSRWWLTLWLGDWVALDDDWKSCQLEVEAMNGQVLGRRPALLYGKPYDVPTYCSVKVPFAETGLLSVGLRVYGR